MSYNIVDSCECGPTDKEIRKRKINKAVFWFGLILSIGFLSYFEVTKYQAAKTADTSVSECIAPFEDFCAPGDSTSCEKE